MEEILKNKCWVEKCKITGQITYGYLCKEYGKILFFFNKKKVKNSWKYSKKNDERRVYCQGYFIKGTMIFSSVEQLNSFFESITNLNNPNGFAKTECVGKNI